MGIQRGRPRRFFYEGELRSYYPKLKAFAKATPTGPEAEINARLDRGHSPRIAGYIAARKWGGLLPSAWDSLSDYDRAWIIATLRIEGLMEAHVSKVQRDVADKDKPAPGRPSDGRFGP